MRMGWLLAGVVLLGACGGDGGSSPSGPKRSFAMGFTDWPSAATQAAVDSAYLAIREDADLAVYHNDGGVPWQEAASGAAFHPSVTGKFADQVARLPAGHKLLLTTTPINFLRNGLALHLGAATNEPLAPPFNALGFGDTLVIRAYTAWCERLIDTFHPTWFAYAIEANEVAVKSPASWPGFLVLAESVYTTLKRNHPTLPVFATMQLETLYQDVSQNGPPAVQLLQWSDVLAFSTYPYVVATDPAQLPAGYLTALTSIANGKPIAISETGWPAESVSAPYPVTIPATPAAQRAWVDRLLTDMNTLQAPFVNWYFSRDYDALYETTLRSQGDSALSRLWKDDGLFAGDGTPRPSLTLWRSWLGRRYAP